MTNLARKPRLVAQNEPLPSSQLESDRLRSAIETLDTDRAAAVAEIDRLRSTRDAVLLTGDDDAADKHDAEAARHGRIVERCDLRRPGLEQELATAQAEEEKAEAAKRQASAELVVQAVIAEIEQGYEEPARQLAEFLARWDNAEQIAKAAGIDGLQARLRTRFSEPHQRSAAVYEDVAFYVDADGRPTTSEHPYRDDGLVDRTRRNERRTERRLKSPAVMSERRDLSLPWLVSATRLPAVALDREHFWPPKGAAV